MATLAESTTGTDGGFRAGFLALLHALWEIPAVVRVTYGVHDGIIYLWVLLSDDDHDFDRAIMAEYDFRGAAGSPLVDIQYFIQGEVDETNLPNGNVLFARS